MLCDVFQSRLFEDWKQSFMSEKLVHIQLSEAFCFLQIHITKPAATPVGLTHFMCVSFIFLDQPLADTKTEIMKTGQS